MRAMITVILIIAAVYWLSGKGIVSLDSVKAKSYIEDVQNRLKGVAPGDNDMTTVNYETGRLCSELRDLSERALLLRQKLLANVVESTATEKMAAGRARPYKVR